MGKPLAIKINKTIKRFDTSNYETDIPLPISKNKKVIELMIYELDSEIIKEFAALRPKMCSHIINDECIDQKAKGTKKYVIK